LHGFIACRSRALSTEVLASTLGAVGGDADGFEGGNLSGAGTGATGGEGAGFIIGAGSGAGVARSWAKALHDAASISKVGQTCLGRNRLALGIAMSILKASQGCDGKTMHVPAAGASSAPGATALRGQRRFDDAPRPEPLSTLRIAARNFVRQATHCSRQYRCHGLNRQEAIGAASILR
jgi:hypothetical protein